ncbi:hypothetical protein [uncultured Sphaerochaeta sp.]|uniref:AlkZ-related protein n=1 Tax=uncultured Sphaerochaeta sp. TaxID=886478 RepID=UPI002A0A6241|nr:hypothetical protein [uncultured Sphaerochaeta sp.]
MNIAPITNAQELSATVETLGFLPFFPNAFKGFSLKESTPLEYWFVKGIEGPWEWKEQVTREGNLAYGTFFKGKTGFINLPWYAHLANYRRKGDDFSTHYQKGLAGQMEKKIIENLTRRGPLLSFELKDLVGKSGFSQALAKLQMKTYVANYDFAHKTGKTGENYGWGVALLALSEEVYGEELILGQSGLLPEESLDLMANHLQKILGVENKEQITGFLK